MFGAPFLGPIGTEYYGGVGTVGTVGTVGIGTGYYGAPLAFQGAPFMGPVATPFLGPVGAPFMGAGYGLGMF